MRITQSNQTIRDICRDYREDDDNGVTGFGGQLDIRPPYQRNFVYDEPERNEVINTIRKGFPISEMYWFDRKNGRFEMIDGQQRTISVCRYVSERSFSVDKDGRTFDRLPEDEQEKILDYPLTIYRCSGTDDELLDWFRIINTAGKKLNDQEIRNALYHGDWVTDAKKNFSKRNCRAKQKGGNYVKGDPNRQEIFEKVLKWVTGGDDFDRYKKITRKTHDDNIRKYMCDHRDDEDADELWDYFSDLIDWVETTFTDRQHLSIMKKVEWGPLYNRYRDEKLDPVEIDERIRMLYSDPHVTNNAGIYSYILTGAKKHLNVRDFSYDIRSQIFESQNRMCTGPKCKKKGQEMKIDDMQADHIDPWNVGGPTDGTNCQMLCVDCHKAKC